MSISSWKYAFCSTVGTSHEKLNTPCQDFGDCQTVFTSDNQPILIITVSDGAGSAKYADIASKLVCTLVLEEMRCFFEAESNIEKININLIKDLINHIQEQINIRAESTNSKVREYACTILVAVIGTTSGVFFQIGDGAIVISSSEDLDDFNWIFWPAKGEYENTTYFITDAQACDNLQFAYVNRTIDKIAVFTDGLQNLALHNKTQTVHPPFFRNLFKFLGTTHETEPEKLAIPITNFLNSQQVNERTDDDKTLVIALRNVNLEG
ncbi:PP2C family serine/threonine-protein phosphatase [Acetivibrio cellulolyticus]|uniref:PP2C family serine/threonine-protein phosphatase n=1 Tax=Acetivibrio cellulolyticus TaxID=35830 RepID=UPI0001E2F0FF|nr:PP2C family serine/threonine-protein phosphatase [Acetivibrio cellulolyticus]